MEAEGAGRACGFGSVLVSILIRALSPATLPAAKRPLARLEWCFGPVYIRTVGSFSWTSALATMSLFDGDLLKTFDGAEAGIVLLEDGYVIEMRPNSLIVIEPGMVLDSGPHTNGEVHYMSYRNQRRTNPDKAR